MAICSTQDVFCPILCGTNYDRCSYRSRMYRSIEGHHDANWSQEEVCTRRLPALLQRAPPVLMRLPASAMPRNLEVTSDFIFGVQPGAIINWPANGPRAITLRMHCRHRDTDIRSIGGASSRIHYPPPYEDTLNARKSSLDAMHGSLPDFCLPRHR